MDADAGGGLLKVDDLGLEAAVAKVVRARSEEGEGGEEVYPAPLPR